MAPHPSTRSGSLRSQVWLITGAPQGFGREWADAAPERGDKVAATARKPETLDPLAEANLFGAVWVTQAALPIMREQGSGHLIQVSFGRRRRPRGREERTLRREPGRPHRHP